MYYTYMTQTETAIVNFLAREGTATRSDVIRNVPRSGKVWESLRIAGRIVPAGMSYTGKASEPLYRLS